ncbi:hypothetical protein O6H91_04G030800 [Diphasiastrum complanatum]|uniref:Uncharacterized protein n=1 Tax=Diphasiastrum complanatum TaxID=34168 RepID=A0ACC2DVF6_DIPCM|nr:hypothetical protein O6H91_04G030800 [Diphasiastrum complanatum]
MTRRSIVEVAMAGAQFVRGFVAPNGLAVLTLDRPRALNAMNLDMDLAYRSYLDEWASDPAVKAVLIEGSTSRAFSAGMDVKWVVSALQDLDSPLLQKVFSAEYSLICAIARYKKPYVSFMDGITMGFGFGLSGHGCYRVVTEKTMLAMPELAIGIFPDVGFANIAARSPGKGALGAYLALTGARVNNPADALYAGLGTHFVPSEKLSLLKGTLLQKNLSDSAHELVQDVLSEYSQEPASEPHLKGLLPSIVSCFDGGNSVLDCIQALKKEQLSSDSVVSQWASAALTSIQKSAPFGLFVTQKHFSSVASAVSKPKDVDALSEIEGVMKTEYRIALRMAVRNDFTEGVRAVLIDKDQNPKWQPPTLEDVNLADVNAVFSPFENELDELSV